MKFHEKIVVMCLTGMIRNERAEEQANCLNAIQHHYGKRIAQLVESSLEEI